jgi:hypothetical protein
VAITAWLYSGGLRAVGVWFPFPSRCVRFHSSMPRTHHHPGLALGHSAILLAITSSSHKFAAEVTGCWLSEPYNLPVKTVLLN